MVSNDDDVILESILNEFLNKKDWEKISHSHKLSESFIRKFKDKVHWGWISRTQTLSEPFIREFRDRVNWNCISQFQFLSEPFIREFKSDVCWYIISCFQKLSEDLIREFKNEVNWSAIEFHQKLSPEFIKEFSEKLPKLYKSLIEFETPKKETEMSLNPSQIKHFWVKWSDKSYWQIFRCHYLNDQLVQASDHFGNTYPEQYIKSMEVIFGPEIHEPTETVTYNET